MYLTKTERVPKPASAHRQRDRVAGGNTNSECAHVEETLGSLLARFQLIVYKERMAFLP